MLSTRVILKGARTAGTDNDSLSIASVLVDENYLETMCFISINL